MASVTCADRRSGGSSVRALIAAFSKKLCSGFFYVILLSRITILSEEHAGDAMAMSVCTGKESMLLSLTALIREAQQRTVGGTWHV